MTKFLAGRIGVHRKAWKGKLDFPPLPRSVERNNITPICTELLYGWTYLIAFGPNFHSKDITVVILAKTEFKEVLTSPPGYHRVLKKKKQGLC